MNTSKALFVFEQVKRVGLNGNMPLELYLGRTGCGEDDWKVLAVFNDDEAGLCFEEITHAGFGWKLEKSHIMLEDDTAQSMAQELGFTLVAKSV